MKTTVEAEKGRLTLERGGMREMLEIRSGYPDTREAEAIFQQFGLMHIVAPHLPGEMTTNFPVSALARDFIARMYASEGKSGPDFRMPVGGNKVTITKLSDSYDALVTFTGGKDSLWNLMRARQDSPRVLAVHISGLNQSVAKKELEYVLRQSKVLGFDLEIIEIKNSKSSRGYIMMRSRDFFLTALAIPTAVSHSACRIILEGGFSIGEEENGVAFCYHMSAWEAFNQMLARMGLSVSAAWYDERMEVGKVKDLIEQKPEWLPLVMNCLSMPVFVDGIKRDLLGRVGNFPFYESQCGGCVKCRTVNIARILYDPEMAKVEPGVIKSYILSTLTWIKRKGKEIEDIVDGSFFEAVTEVARRYGLA